MILQCYCVFDSAVGAYMRPMYMVSKGQAIRAFTDEVNRKADDNPMWQHPEDYQLFSVGEWDDSTGMHFYELSNAVRVVTALDVLTK
ncbi:MAG: nonstructural protein [Arizlama microvirus]|nr:MAG: nonstructural protein [Arizlama microvirus]